MTSPSSPGTTLRHEVQAAEARARRRARSALAGVGLVLLMVGLGASGQLAPSRLARAIPGYHPSLAPVDRSAPGMALVVTARQDVAEVVAYATPDADAEPVAVFPVDAEFPPYFLSLLDFDAYAAADHEGWIEVLLPVRPNGTTGWLSTADVDLYETPYRVEIDVSEFRLGVFRDNEVVHEATIGVGGGATPTPLGRFFLTDLYEVPNPDGVYGPYAFALSGYSDTLTSFAGGDGIVGLHGTNDPGSLGTRVSHGCIRLPNELIVELAGTLPLGTPVVIVE